MSLVFRANADRPDGDGKENSFLLLSSAEILGNKVNTIIRIIHEIEPLVRLPDEDGKDYVDKDERPLATDFDGEVRSSAESTMIRALGRLDTIIDNDENWDMAIADKVLDRRIAQLHRLNMKAAQARLELIQNQNRPSYRVKSKLFRDGENFLAVVGDDPWGINAVVGKGRTPEEAFTNLDAILTAKFKPSDDSS